MKNIVPERVKTSVGKSKVMRCRTSEGRETEIETEWKEVEVNQFKSIESIVSASCEVEVEVGHRLSERAITVGSLIRLRRT